MEDIHYTNLMLEFEKLDGRLDCIEEKLGEMECELKGTPTLASPSGISVETFSSVQLTEKDATRFLRHVNEDAPNPKAKASYQRGKDVLRHVLNQQLSPFWNEGDIDYCSKEPTS